MGMFSPLCVHYGCNPCAVATVLFFLAPAIRVGVLTAGGAIVTGAVAILSPGRFVRRLRLDRRVPGWARELAIPSDCKHQSTSIR